jgi:hypothetical protein
MTTTTTSGTSSDRSVSGRADTGTVIVFTDPGRAALDRLAATLTAGCDPDSPDAVAGVLDRVLHAPIDQLAAALAPIPARPVPRPPGVRHHGTGRASTPRQAR